MSIRPLISFVVSVYNLERYIGECLDSILAQPFDDYEIVLVDNNSEDGSRAICRYYAGLHERIRYFELDGEPLGGRAVLYGLHAASGTYVQAVDGDDLLSPGIYRVIADALREKAPDVLFGQFETFSDEGTLNYVDAPYSPDLINNGSMESALTYLVGHLPLHLTMWRLICSREILVRRQEVFYDPTRTNGVVTRSAPLHYDVTLNNQALMLADSIYYIDKPMYRYRLRRSSVSRTSAAEQASAICLTLITHEELLLVEGLSRRKRDYILSIMDAWHYSLHATLSVLDGEELQKCVAKIKDSVRNLPEQGGNNWPDRIRYPILALRQSGEPNTVLGHSWATARHTIDKIVASLTDGYIYLAPTGNVGEHMKTIFEAYGIQISAFLDNDEKKAGTMLGGTPIWLPSAVSKVHKPIAVVIASMYANVRWALKQQFISLGIHETRIFVVEFEY
ncbi:glycosyltransferase family 2 protein [Paenibacillus mesotrionivorans]|uniref:Glycosyltransferase family 2 protein n=1 Tax=Paenibacillus mesotrionivorans TaxID=3160968 RepID=A0ACC7P0U9_9BACL